MLGEWVLDASVAAKCLFNETDSHLARAFVVSAHGLTAPDFIFVELSSVAAKKVRRGETSRDFAAEALVRAPGLLTVAASTRPLLRRAFELATDKGFSVYDALYLALAETKEIPVVTADRKFSERAHALGVAGLVIHFSQVPR